jgi:hypothetical protein
MSENQPSFPVAFLQRLRFPQLFVVLLILFGADLLVPDLIPFFDEVLLGVLTLMMGALRRRDDRARQEDDPLERVEKNITPRS